MGAKPGLSHSGKNKDRVISTTGCCEKVLFQGGGGGGEVLESCTICSPQRIMKYEIGGECNTCGIGDKHVQTFCRETRTDGASVET